MLFSVVRLLCEQAALKPAMGLNKEQDDAILNLVSVGVFPKIPLISIMSLMSLVFKTRIQLTSATGGLIPKNT